MEAILIAVLGVVVLAGFGLVYVALRRTEAKLEKPDQGALMMLQNQVQEITRTLDSKLSESGRMIQTHFGESARIVRDVTEKLTRLDETNKQVVGFADQLKNLQDILKNPKQRGILGEYYLETVLKNVLPPGSYQMQYPFKDGVIVDAAVFVDKRIIPVDSKFSLENYNRILEARDPLERKRFESALVTDLKTRVDETSKYVKPEEDTMDFAFMFIPSEAIYYDLLVNKIGAVSDDQNLIAYAGKKRVIIVSPTSFLAYLQTVLQGLKNQRISEQAKAIVKQVESLGKHLLSYEEYLAKLGKNLGTTVSMYNNTYREFSKIDKDVMKISGTAMGVEPVVLDGPNPEELPHENNPGKLL
jgi:DNA recombination protein RmuC